ncbi:hypothetical protein CEXT_58651 [Caerostris extrusa]|uniref:Uncharacterized protein n=1 Tax=Caerostris extrusa TaxID=172846 RepID=A0AAV4ME96_CAEEX|nr:hypothetical protein CEXT_58651 [Caerostris extrusa]
MASHLAEIILRWGGGGDIVRSRVQVTIRQLIVTDRNISALSRKKGPRSSNPCQNKGTCTVTDSHSNVNANHRLGGRIAFNGYHSSVGRGWGYRSPWSPNDDTTTANY